MASNSGLRLSTVRSAPSSKSITEVGEKPSGVRARDSAAATARVTCTAHHCYLCTGCGVDERNNRVDPLVTQC